MTVARRNGEKDLNSREYWDLRFSGADWRKKGGTRQSYLHAAYFGPAISLASDFAGSICDFGCAEGDAFPVYRKLFPQAKLIGVDFSEHAVRSATERYGNLGDFRCGDVDRVPYCDAIICSHTLEHIQEEYEVLEELLKRARDVFIIVPYKEMPLSKEHLRMYDEFSYGAYSPASSVVVRGGWPYGYARLWYQIYFKNIFRMILGKPIRREPKQIVFHFLNIQKQER